MIVSVAQAQLFFLALTRIMAMTINIPVLGGKNIPNQVRIGLGLVLALVLIPWQPLPAGTETIGFLGFAVAIGKEALIGTLAGFAASLTFGAIQIAAEIMELGSGFASGHVLNPSMGNTGSAYNQLFVILSTLYFLVIDGHHTVLIAMERTFKVIPINGSLPFNSLDALIQMTSQLIASGIQLALPVMVALFLTDMTLGLLARVAPQVQVYVLGLPLKVGVSLIAMGMLFTIILPHLADLYQSIGNRMLQLLVR
jgi:flagellar biosynthetic protein FliR